MIGYELIGNDETAIQPGLRVTEMAPEIPLSPLQQQLRIDRPWQIGLRENSHSNVRSLFRAVIGAMEFFGRIRIHSI
jgi:hypothetical protein